MKRVLIILLSIIILFSCSPTTYNLNSNNINKNDSTELVFGVSQRNQYERNFSFEQFDSICRADKISNNLNQKWHKIKLFNKDTGKQLIQYLYIRNLPNEQHIYRVQLTDNEDSLKITKRIEK